MLCLFVSHFCPAFLLHPCLNADITSKTEDDYWDHSFVVASKKEHRSGDDRMLHTLEIHILYPSSRELRANVPPTLLDADGLIESKAFSMIFMN
jgi:hypothetical protein